MSFTRHQAALHTLRVACVGLLLWIAWMAYLAVGRGSLPSTLGWVLLDLAELAALVTTARLLHHHDDRTASASLVSATLLISDAAVDVATSAQGSQQVLALAMAAMVEIPLALLCCSIAAVVHASRQATGKPGQPSRIPSLATGAARDHSYAAVPSAVRLREPTRAGMRWGRCTEKPDIVVDGRPTPRCSFVKGGRGLGLTEGEPAVVHQARHRPYLRSSPPMRRPQPPRQGPLHDQRGVRHHNQVSHRSPRSSPHRTSVEARTKDVRAEAASDMSR